ncbi:MAG: hypothetical protein DRN92_06715, partial [Thermoproteota archaeon]
PHLFTPPQHASAPKPPSHNQNTMNAMNAMNRERGGRGEQGRTLWLTNTPHFGQTLYLLSQPPAFFFREL